MLELLHSDRCFLSSMCVLWKSKVSSALILKTMHGCYQLNKTTVNVERLKAKLRSWPLNLLGEEEERGEEGEEEGGGGAGGGGGGGGGGGRGGGRGSDPRRLCTRVELEQTMQCSVVELQAALRALGAFDFEGHVRVLDVESECAVARHLALSINAEGLDLHRLRREDVVKASSGAGAATFPDSVLEHAADAFLLPMDATPQKDSTNSSSSSSGSSSSITSHHQQYYKFDEQKYAAIVAQTMLRSKPKDFWTLSAFLTQLRSKIPDNFSADESALAGLVCTQERGKDVTLTYLPASSMSHTPRKRLNELFQHKPKWTFAELKPYLQDLITAETNEEQLLVQHTRSSTGPAGVKLYSAR